MKKLLLALGLALVLAACQSQSGVPLTSQEDGIRYVHDSERGVGCWYFDSGSYGSGLYCIPDGDY